MSSDREKFDRIAQSDLHNARGIELAESAHVAACGNTAYANRFGVGFDVDTGTVAGNVTSRGSGTGIVATGDRIAVVGNAAQTIGSTFISVGADLATVTANPSCYP